MELETPRDRQASFEPKIVGKRQTRWTGFDDKIISMYARGMTTREIQGHLEEIYGIEVSPALISNVTEAVIEEVKQWQKRPLSVEESCSELAPRTTRARPMIPMPYAALSE